MLHLGKYILPFILVFLFFSSTLLFASPDVESAKSTEQLAEELQHNLNIVWTCIAAFLVFFMQAGFAMVEAGFTRAKNAINILMKNWNNGLLFCWLWINVWAQQWIIWYN